jgi:sugar-specific transcriptional regulator TrmB
MYEELLKECGLTTNEAKVYLTLLRVGKSSSGRIISESKISGGKVYETLDKLIAKGLIKTFIENNIKQFVANDPKMLISYIKDKKDELSKKEESLRKLIPKLTAFGKNPDTFETVALLKGTKAIGSLAQHCLSNAENIRIMGVRSSKEVKYNNFWKEWHKERVRLKKKARMIFSDKKTEYWNFFKKLSYTDVRGIMHLSHSALMIIDAHVLIFSYEEDFTCIHINADSIARSFATFFDDLWGIAEK